MSLKIHCMILKSTSELYFLKCSILGSQDQQRGLKFLLTLRVVNKKSDMSETQLFSWQWLCLMKLKSSNKQKPYKKLSLHTILNKQVALGTPHKAAHCLLKRFSIWGFYHASKITAPQENPCSLAVGALSGSRLSIPNSKNFHNDQISSSEQLSSSRSLNYL